MRTGDAKIVPTAPIFRATGVSKEYGLKVMAKLEARGEISPHKTTSGRVTLTFDDSERLASCLAK